MKLKTFLIILAAILCVGLIAGGVARNNGGSAQSVSVRPNSAANNGTAAATEAPATTEAPAITEAPATTEADEPATEPEEVVFRISLLIEESLVNFFTVQEDGVDVEPIDVVEYGGSGEAKGGNSDPDPDDPVYQIRTYVRFLVDPSTVSVSYDHALRPADPWCILYRLYYDVDESGFYLDYESFSSSSGTLDLSDSFFAYIVPN